MKRKLISVIFLLGSMCLVTGCWDSTELNEKHVVLDVAIDKNTEMNNGEDESEVISEQNGYTVTYAIPDIAKLSGNDSLSEDVKTVLSVNSASIAESVDKIEAQTQNTISFSHTKALILGEELLKDSRLLKMAMNSFMENTEVGRATYLLAARGKAQEISSAESYQNPIIGLYVTKFFNNTERAIGDCEEQTLGNFNKEIKEYRVSTLPIISQNKEDSTLQINNGAVIKDYSLVGWLNADEIRAKMLLDEKVKDLPIIVKIDNNDYMYQLQSEECKIDYKKQNGKLIIDIQIENFGKLTEYALYDLTKDNGEVISRQVASKVNEKLKQTILAGIEKAQTMNADFLHLSLDLYRKHPDIWKEYEAIWQEDLYSGAVINISVNTIIEGIGMM